MDKEFMDTANGKSNHMELDYAAIGKRIRACRKQKRMTLADMGKAVGLSTSFIGFVERGSRIPSLETVYRISKALDISVDTLLTGFQLMDKNQSETNKMQILNGILRILRDNADDWLPYIS